MPSWVKDHDLWMKAKQVVLEKKGVPQDELSNQDWGLVTHIYKKMGGRVESAVQYIAEELHALGNADLATAAMINAYEDIPANGDEVVKTELSDDGEVLFLEFASGKKLAAHVEPPNPNPRTSEDSEEAAAAPDAPGDLRSMCKVYNCSLTKQSEFEYEIKGNIPPAFEETLKFLSYHPVRQKGGILVKIQPPVDQTGDWRDKAKRSKLPVTARTQDPCEFCSSPCCSCYVIDVLQRDMDRICDALGGPKEKYFEQKLGIWKVRDTGGTCMFMNKTKPSLRCSIYEHRPWACRHYHYPRCLKELTQHRSIIQQAANQMAQQEEPVMAAANPAKEYCAKLFAGKYYMPRVGAMFYDSVVVDAWPYPGETEAVYFNIITVKGRGKGHGGKALKHMCDLADKYGVTLIAEVKPFGTDREGPRLTKQQLVSWYKQHGFVPGWEIFHFPFMSRPPKGAKANKVGKAEGATSKLPTTPEELKTFVAQLPELIKQARIKVLKDEFGTKNPTVDDLGNDYVAWTVRPSAGDKTPCGECDAWAVIEPGDLSSPFFVDKVTRLFLSEGKLYMPRADFWNRWNQLKLVTSIDSILKLFTIKSNEDSFGDDE